MNKKLIALFCLIFVFAQLPVFAYNIVENQFDDSGLISSSFLKQTRETQRTIRYTPWLINYALQTEQEAQSGVDGGEGFQQISDIAVSPVDNNLILFGTDTCGLWRSDNGGNSWLSVNDGINCWGVHDIIFHPSEKNVAYLIQGGANASISTNQIQSRTSLDGLYKSTDGGKSWKQLLNINIRSAVTTNRLMAFDNDGNFYLLSSEGLICTSDGGTTWGTVYSFTENYQRSDMLNFDLCISGDTIVFTNSEYGVFASFDKGTTWQKRNIDSCEQLSAYGLDISPDNPAEWLCCFGGAYNNLYKTLDSGMTWNVQLTGEENSYSASKYPLKVLYGKRSSVGERAIYMLFKNTYTPLRVSYDDGATWNAATYTTPWNTSYSPFYGHAISLESEDPDCVFLGVGTVLKSTDGGRTFSARNTPGYCGANVEEIKFSDSGRIYLSITDSGLYKSNEQYNGENYPTFQNTRDQNYSVVGDVAIDPDNENHIIYAEATPGNYSLRESTDGAQSWTEIPNTDADGAPSLITFHNANQNIIYSTYYTSYNGGTSWSANEIKISSVSPVNNNTVYGFSGKNVYKSVDCGVSWEALYSSDVKVCKIMADSASCDALWCGLVNGNVVKISGTETSVLSTTNGLSNVAACAMAQNPNNPQHIVIGGNCTDYSPANNAYYTNYCKTPGIYETYDGGQTWHVVKGMPSMRVVYSLAFSPDTDEIFIGGFTGGLLVYNYDEYKKYIESENSIDKNFSVIYNGSNRMVTVSGKLICENENADSTIVVIPDGVTLSNAQYSDIVYINQIPISANGDFEYSFKMPEACANGSYNVYLGGSKVYLLGVGKYNNGMFNIGSFVFDNINEITTSLTVTNTSDESKSLLLFIAQYNGNTLLGIETKMFFIPANTVDSVTKTISMPLENDTTFYRAFVWDNLKQMTPLTGFIENIVKEND